MATIYEVESYWNVQPCSVLHGKSEKGSLDYFDELTHRRYFVQPHIPAFAEFGKWRDKKVLEIGCGVGTDAEQFARYSADYTGVELSEASMNLAAERFRLNKLPGRFYKGNAENLEQILPPSAKYDLVYSFGVIHHTPDPKAVIRQAHYMMERGSQLRIMLYAENSYKAALIDAGLAQSEAQADCPIANRYTEQQIIDLLAPQFTVTRLVRDHIFPYQVEPYKNHEYVKEPWFQAMPDDVFRAMEVKLGWHWLIWAEYA